MHINTSRHPINPNRPALARGPRVPPPYPRSSHPPPQRRCPGTQPLSTVPISRRPANPRRPNILPPFREPQRMPTHLPTVNVPDSRRITPSDLNDELSGVDTCNMIQMNETAFDNAYNDPYFSRDTCNMIHMDNTSKPEVNDDTVLYAASAKIVDTVRADHENLGHIPLLQLKKMIQTNIISPHGASDRAQLLSTFNQIKAAIARGFFCPTCAIVENSCRTPAPRVYPKATVYGGLISTDISGPYAQVGPTSNNMVHWFYKY